jgi:hypothetical protein
VNDVINRSETHVRANLAGEREDHEVFADELDVVVLMITVCASVGSNRREPSRFDLAIEPTLASRGR